MIWLRKKAVRQLGVVVIGVIRCNNVESAKAFLTPDRALPKSIVGGRKEDLRAISGTFQGGNMTWTMGLGAGSSCATKKMGQGRWVLGPR